MNNYPYLVPLILLLTLIVLIAFFIYLVRNTYYLSNRIKYSFLNRFPFEAVFQKRNVLYGFQIGFLIAIAALLVTVNGLYASTFKSPSTLAYAISIGVMFTLNIIACVLCFFVTPDNLKNFKLYSMLSIVLGILSNAMLGIFSMSGVFDHYSFKIVGAFAFILMLTNVVIAFNPKLKDWDKLVENKSLDGSIIYVRPKVSPLAASLWINFLTIVLGEGLILVNMLLASTIGV